MLTKSPFQYCVPTANQQPFYRRGAATLVCKAVVAETHDTKTFFFEDSRNRGFDFKPGKYATFRFHIDGKIYPRAYSLSSSPSRPHNVAITVKRAPGGTVSNWLNDNVRPGMEIDILDICGRFNYLDIPSRKPLFLSGGSGITPVMSMLQFINDTADRADLVFVHFAKTPQDIIFRDQLEFIAKRYENVALRLVVDDDCGDVGFTGATGVISASLMRSLVSDLEEREIFMCGPEGFMKAARAIAPELGVLAVHEESFGEKVVVEATAEEGGPVTFSLSGMTGECRPGETVLEAALNVGVWINSSCQMGACGSCRIKVARGTVRTDDHGGICNPQDHMAEPGISGNIPEFVGKPLI
ncbi:hybrid-cluster NAD(P)-dependent oxidoreductase [Martelella limonii]|uniref:hybrid-cluster NAD(P)-dependent oxidoreductase n=1 Tax=Martelella limonii TaxID=1647649 RepID=UPI001580232A|nr:hybrid-cluster NAD(P)-dependent oxidoreductase [Martelella limonii]